MLENIDIIHQFKKRKGVWALFGERDGEYFCLNVAKTVDVGKEISTDASWLKDQEHGKPDRDYYNQFAEFQFRYNCIIQKESSKDIKGWKNT